MKDLYDRIVWTVIACALAAIALNPWIAPGRSVAQEGIVRVDLARIDGSPYGGNHLPLPVRIEK